MEMIYEMKKKKTKGIKKNIEIRNKLKKKKIIEWERCHKARKPKEDWEREEKKNWG